MLASAAAYSSNIAADESTTYRTLCVKRAVHEADTDMRAVLYWLEQSRNCKNQNHCCALGNSLSSSTGARQRRRDESTNSPTHRSATRHPPQVDDCSLPGTPSQSSAGSARGTALAVRDEFRG